MFALTRHEKIVILFLVVIFVGGAIFDYVFKKEPNLFNKISILENKSFIKKIDINKASYEDLLGIPHVGPVMARKVIDYRREYGSFESIEELKAVGLSSKIFKKVQPYLFVRKK